MRKEKKIMRNSDRLSKKKRKSFLRDSIPDERIEELFKMVETLHIIYENS